MDALLGFSDLLVYAVQTGVSWLQVAVGLAVSSAAWLLPRALGCVQWALEASLPPLARGVVLAGSWTADLLISGAKLGAAASSILCKTLTKCVRLLLSTSLYMLLYAFDALMRVVSAVLVFLLRVVGVERDSIGERVLKGVSVGLCIVVVCCCADLLCRVAVYSSNRRPRAQQRRNSRDHLPRYRPQEEEEEGEEEEEEEEGEEEEEEEEGEEEEGEEEEGEEEEGEEGEEEEGGEREGEGQREGAQPMPEEREEGEASIHRRLNQLSQQLEREREQKLCVICLSRERNLLLHPCKHYCVCKTCARHVQDCPVCRRRIHHTEVIFNA